VDLPLTTAVLIALALQILSAIPLTQGHGRGFDHSETRFDSRAKIPQQPSVWYGGPTA